MNKIDFEQEIKDTAHKKWERLLEGGFQQIPHILFKNQYRLNLNSNDLVVLLNIMIHWWNPSDHPYPRTSTIVARMGIDKRTAQRSILKLQELGLIQKIELPAKGRKESLKAYDLTGLLIRLSEFNEKDTSFMVRSWLKQKQNSDNPQPEQSFGTP